MSNRCDQELCPFWTGEGCACAVMGIERDPREEPIDCLAPLGNLCTETGCWDADRCIVSCACGKPASHVNADEDSAEWACRVPNFDPQTGRILDA